MIRMVDSPVTGGCKNQWIAFFIVVVFDSTNFNDSPGACKKLIYSIQDISLMKRMKRGCPKCQYLCKKRLKSRTPLYHFLFWAGIYTLWVAVFRSYSVPITKTMTIEFCYLIFITADYYCINHFIVPGDYWAKGELFFLCPASCW